MKRLILLLFIMTSLFAFSYAEENTAEEPEVIAARTLFELLQAGDASAAELIDWQSLQIYGNKYGEAYLALTDESQRAEFRTKIIKGFAGILSEITPAEFDRWIKFSDEPDIGVAGTGSDYMIYFKFDPVTMLLHTIFVTINDDYEYEEW